MGQRQHCRAVTSFPLMVKGKAWSGIKDPPAGEGQVGQKQHWRAVTSLALLERARAWEWVKDPPAGEGQVGQKKHLFVNGRTGRIKKARMNLQLTFPKVRNEKARLLEKKPR